MKILKKLIVERIDRDGIVVVEEDFAISEERVDFYLNGTKTNLRHVYSKRPRRSHSRLFDERGRA